MVPFLSTRLIISFRGTSFEFRLRGFSDADKD
jgi:hypothetical protein